MILLSNDLIFPPTHLADEDGLLCIGGDLSTERLKLAYSLGIFPWYNEDEPILWHSPDPRFVLFPEKLYISKSMQKIIAKEELGFSFNQSFDEVIYQCKIQKRRGQAGTWINNEMEEAYKQLHHEGIAMSAECWMNGDLVGGLYGIRTGNLFCGESMFSVISNASKFALIKTIQYLLQDGVRLIDCQVYTPHLESLGAEMISRNEFENYLHT